MARNSREKVRAEILCRPLLKKDYRAHRFERQWAWWLTFCFPSIIVIIFNISGDGDSSSGNIIIITIAILFLLLSTLEKVVIITQIILQLLLLLLIIFIVMVCRAVVVVEVAVVVMSIQQRELLKTASPFKDKYYPECNQFKADVVLIP